VPCVMLMRREGRGRRAVRCMRASTSRSMTSFRAAVPPETKPTPIMAASICQEREEKPPLRAPRKKPQAAVTTTRVVTRALMSSE